MWIVGVFMALNVDKGDVEKYQLKWLRVLSCVERTWVWVFCMPIMCYLIIIILIIWLSMLNDGIIIELY